MSRFYGTSSTEHELELEIRDSAAAKAAWENEGVTIEALKNTYDKINRQPVDSKHARARTLVYVAGPFSPTPEQKRVIEDRARDQADRVLLRRVAVEDNIERAARLGLQVAKLGAYPVVPHSNTALPEYEDVQGYEFWIEGTAEMLRRCDAVVFTPDWQDSSGARGEERLAAELGIPRFYTLSDLACWLLPGMAFKTGEVVPVLDEEPLCGKPIKSDDADMSLTVPSVPCGPDTDVRFDTYENGLGVKAGASLAELAKTIPTLAPERNLADAFDENEPGTSPEIPSLRPGRVPNTGV